jgi:hypothetical protein
MGAVHEGKVQGARRDARRASPAGPTRPATSRGMTWTLIAVVGALTWIIATLAIEIHLRRNRLTERLLPYHAPYVADDAQHWLDSREP